jgi:PepSY-associated transmembrane protein/peptidase YpeB-like protein
MAEPLWRLLVITHRYLGVTVGLLMLMWFLSGIVMMYVGFPRVSDQARTRTLMPIAWQACCRFDERLAADDETTVRAQLENLAGLPTLRLQRIGRRDNAIDLVHGTAMRIDAEQAQAIVLDAAPRIIGRPARVVVSEYADQDQWTVGRLFRDRPLYRFEFDDPERTHIYVSSTTGQVVHWTSATQRFWNWLGAIPHWIYPTMLRSNVALWTQVVIWASLLGTFLTVLGICLGVTQFRRGSERKLSPYRGLLCWHHIVGLVFGLVVLTWVASGLVSMNPWGFLEGRRSGGEQARVSGAAPKWTEVRTSLEAMRTLSSLSNVVSLVTAPLDGRLYWLATRDDGTVMRIDATGNVVALTADELARAARRVAGSATIAEQALIDEEDAYYFTGHDVDVVLPVYRMILGDAEATRYYFDPRSGALIYRVDVNGRWHRWLFSGLHRIDFTVWMRARPLWDIIVLPLMLGGLAVTATGVYLAFRRVRSDLAFLFRLLRRPAVAHRQSID